MATSNGRFLTTSQASRVLGVSAQWVRDLCARGKLEYVGTPLGKLIERQSVERLKAEREGAR